MFEEITREQAIDAARGSAEVKCLIFPKDAAYFRKGHSYCAIRKGKLHAMFTQPEFRKTGEMSSLLDDLMALLPITKADALSGSVRLLMRKGFAIKRTRRFAYGVIFTMEKKVKHEN